MHFAFLFVLFTFWGFHSSHFLSHFSSPFQSLFDHSSAKQTRRSQKVDQKVAKKEPKLATVNYPNDLITQDVVAATEEEENLEEMDLELAGGADDVAKGFTWDQLLADDENMYEHVN